MTELNIELPVKINGVIITSDLLGQVELLQDVGTDNAPNSLIRTYKEQLTEISDYLIGVISENNKDFDCAIEIKHIQSIYWMKSMLNDLCTP